MIASIREIRRLISSVDIIPRQDGKLFFISGWQCRLLILAAGLDALGSFDLRAACARILDQSAEDLSHPDSFYPKLLQALTDHLSTRRLIDMDELHSSTRGFTGSAAAHHEQDHDHDL